jgi:predicted O-methyltransferase YrrM
MQALGVHVTPNHFYSPVPDTRRINRQVFDRPSDLLGVDLREKEQLLLLESLASSFRAEYSLFPRRRSRTDPDTFYLDNKFFSSVDAELLYAMVRKLKPKRIVEIGSGYSTLLIVQAAAVNREADKSAKIVCIDPYPRQFVTALAASGHIELIQTSVERVPFENIGDLSNGDILFIDSSHVLKTGGDVHREFLELLPRLGPGSYVHVHDIFLPHDYPAEWVMDNHWFWNEQYLLQAFLSFNSEFEIVLAAAWLHYQHRDRLVESIPSYDPETVLPGSFWMRRRSV